LGYFADEKALSRYMSTVLPRYLSVANTAAEFTATANMITLGAWKTKDNIKEPLGDIIVRSAFPRAADPNRFAEFLVFIADNAVSAPNGKTLTLTKRIITAAAQYSAKHRLTAQLSAIFTSDYLSAHSGLDKIWKEVSKPLGGFFVFKKT
ncbi:MAG: hypothetical protein LBN42_01230, partial [Oscillospiraceae bacterium]|jgi:hypothetical protein|nr:hypothetical protein [Oscillospiraceae bacterium]